MFERIIPAGCFALQDLMDFLFSQFPPARQCQATCPPVPYLLTFQLSGDRGAGRRVAGGDETEKAPQWNN